ncbi:MAG: hypothetical protein ACOYWZ_06995 [Bacillota bacterium]
MLIGNESEVAVKVLKLIIKIIEIKTFIVTFLLGIWSFNMSLVPESSQLYKLVVSTLRLQPRWLLTIFIIFFSGIILLDQYLLKDGTKES